MMKPHLLSTLLILAALPVSVMADPTPATTPPAPAPKPDSNIGNPQCTDIRNVVGTVFRYCPPVDLIPRSINFSGSPAKSPAYGAYDETMDGKTIHHDGMDPAMDWSDALIRMCFPIRSQAFANSIVYNAGGDHFPSVAKPSSTQGAAANYAYPWRDNFCEGRPASRHNVSCRAGQGHQGQDIRPEKPLKVTYVAIAPEDAHVISAPGADGKGFTVTLQGASPPYRKYRYLHMESISVSPAHPDIRAGDELGRVSDYFGWHEVPQFTKDASGKKVPLYVLDADGTNKLDGKGKPMQIKQKVYDHTLIHLHFEIFLSQAETVGGITYKAGTYVSPYMAIVNAYGRKMALKAGETDPCMAASPGS